jgi:N utilization substance protein B
VSARRESPRKRSRAAALQVLFSLEFGRRRGERPPSGPGERPLSGPSERAPSEAADDADLAARAQAAFDDVGAHFELPEGARAYAKELVLGVASERHALDALITEHASHWRVERMASVDRNILRLAGWELLRTDVPAPAVIDEAVELARRFGGDRSPGFVNGVLDAIAAVVRPPEETRR